MTRAGYGGLVVLGGTRDLRTPHIALARNLMSLSRDDRGRAMLGGLVLDTLFDDPALGVRTPAYVYDLDAIGEAAKALSAGFDKAPHLVAYAVKANTAGPILDVLQGIGCGAEVVSGGELAAVLAAGFAPDRIVYNGVCKLDEELDQAIGAGILAIQMESVEEIGRVQARAKALGRRTRVSLRINPNIEADTHAAVATGHDEAKFGIPHEDLSFAWEALTYAPQLDVVGVSCHIGSQLTRTDEYLAAADMLIEIAAGRESSHGPLSFINFGGGFGIDYGEGCPSTPADFARAVVRKVSATSLAGRLIVVEPGRCLVAAHGVLCATVVMTKCTRRTKLARRWMMIDAGMNDLIRPALYAARHRIEPMGTDGAATGEVVNFQVVGPVCESSDDFGEHRFAEPAPRRVILRDVGAYGYTMASEYNGRALPTEVFLGGGRVVAVSKARGVEEWVAERTGKRSA